LTEKNEKYPVTTLHRFLEEASEEFRRFRLQATINLVGSVILLFLLARFVLFLSEMHWWRPPNTRFGPPWPVDSLLFVAAAIAVVWSFNVWWRHRRFVSRWGERFEKLQAIEKELLE
jgi:hypothetical protein